MNGTGMTGSFSFEYMVSIIVVIIVCNALYKSNSQMNIAIIILVGLVVGYGVLLIMTNFFPYISDFAYNVYQYMSYVVMNNFTSMGYIHVWPPILAILIIFIVLLYNRQLG
jgi:hypothetical protein